MEVLFKGHRVDIQPDGVPFREEQAPIEIMQSQNVILRLLDADGRTLVTADSFGYRVNGLLVSGLGCPFSNLQRYIESTKPAEAK